MSPQETAYKYTIPLEEDDGVERPVYSTSGGGDTFQSLIMPDAKVVVSAEAIPHLHKDSVNVQTEEVSLEEYSDNTPKGGDE
jgi:hypothetical protein